VRPVRPYAAALAALAVVLAGCGDDGTPSAEPSDSSGTTASSPTSPSESPDASATPAAGKAMKGPSYTARAPEGWKVEARDNALSGLVIASKSKEDGSLVGMISIADGPAFVEDTNAQLARELVRSSEFQRPPKVLEDLRIDGVEVYQVAGKVDEFDYTIQLGTIFEENLVEVRIESYQLSPQEMRETLESVLASWQWA
jgi:hypothetical protein